MKDGNHQNQAYVRGCNRLEDLLVDVQEWFLQVRFHQQRPSLQHGPLRGQECRHHVRGEYQFPCFQHER